MSNLERIKIKSYTSFDKIKNNELLTPSVGSSDESDDTLIMKLNTYLSGFANIVIDAEKEESYGNNISIHDFEIIEIISEGGYGKVFLPRKATTGDIYAIKKIYKYHLKKKNLFHFC